MPRQLKTFITNLGFFELAIAAPSMKAALQAWGMSHNAFQQGFAKETDDPRIIKATMGHPGIVLKRPVGSDDEFAENAALPTRLPTITPPMPVRPPSKQAKAKKQPIKDKNAERAAVISFEKERARREAAQAREDAKAEKARAARKRAIDAAVADLAEAAAEHEKEMEHFEREREKLERRVDLTVERWEAQKEKLEAAIDKARHRR